MTYKICKIEVIKPGVLVRNEMGIILDARSTVTLIQSDEHNILVDTSLKKDRELLLKALEKLNLTPNDVDIVILTHCHKDHMGNIELFPSAHKVTHHACPFLSDSEKVERFPFSIQEGVELIETPGHSWDSITVLVKAEKVYAITGDAIPIKSNYENWIPPVIHVDAQLALESMKKIVQQADIIIPGHDSPFEVNKSKEILD